MYSLNASQEPNGPVPPKYGTSTDLYTHTLFFILNMSFFAVRGSSATQEGDAHRRKRFIICIFVSVSSDVYVRQASVYRREGCAQPICLFLDVRLLPVN